MEYILLSLKVILIIAIGISVHLLLQRLANRLHQKELLPPSLLLPIKGIMKWVMVIFIFLLVLQQLGISISRVAAALTAVLVLVAVGFVAFWSILTNILSSFLLVMFPPFRIGDTVEIREPDKEKGTIGKVIDLNIFYTTLVDSSASTGDPAKIRVPNSLFFQRIIICHAGKDTKSLKKAINEPDLENRSE